MKKTFVILFWNFVIISAGFTQPIEIVNRRAITAEDRYFEKAKWRPDGKALLISGKRNSGLHLLNFSDTTIKKISETRYKDATWLNTKKIAYSKGEEVFTIDVETSLTNTTDSASVFVYANLSDRKLYAYFPEKAESSVICDISDYYYSPLISPDQSNVVVHIGSAMYLVPLDGSGRRQLLANGIAGSWSPDGRLIYYFMDETEDGYSITNSDLYAIDIETLAQYTITYTNDNFEMWPAISPDGSKIVFQDYLDGRLYIADIKYVD